MFGLQFATLLQLPFGIAVSLLTGTPSEPPPTTFQILWGHPFAAPFFSKSWTLQRNWTWQCPQNPEAIQKNLASFCAIQILVFVVSYWLSLHNASTCFKILEFEGVHLKLGSSCLLTVRVNEKLWICESCKALGRSVARTRAPIEAQTSEGKPMPQPSSTTRFPLLRKSRSRS